MYEVMNRSKEISKASDYVLKNELRMRNVLLAKYQLYDLWVDKLHFSEQFQEHFGYLNRFQT